MRLVMSCGNGLGDGLPPSACRPVCLFSRTFLVLASLVGHFGCVLSFEGFVVGRNAAPSVVRSFTSLEGYVQSEGESKKKFQAKFDVYDVVFPGPELLFHGYACGFWISSDLVYLSRCWRAAAWQLHHVVPLSSFATNCSSGHGHVLGLLISASGEIFIACCFAEASAMIDEFKLKIAEAVTLVITAAAFSASLGFLTLVREFSGSVGYKGPSYAAAAAATPRVDVEKGPQTAAAGEYVVACSQVTSRCLVQKHPDLLFGKRKEEMEKRKIREDGGDTVLLVRGLQGNTMVVHCGSGWAARDLSDSLRVRTSVPVHLFYLVVGRASD